METYYDGFCGFKTIEQFHKMYPKEYTVENLYDLFEVKEIKKRARRCETCKELIKFDEVGNKAKFYRFSFGISLVALGQSLSDFEDVVCCSKDCITAFLEARLGNLEDFIKEYNVENEKFVKEMVDGIIESSIKHGINPYK